LSRKGQFQRESDERPPVSPDSGGGRMKNWKRLKCGESSLPWMKSATTWNSEFTA
jgi:hypothetical protein